MALQTRMTPQEAYRNIRAQGSTLKRQIDSLITLSASRNTSGTKLWNLFVTLEDDTNRLVGFSGVSGLQKYSRDQLGDDQANVVEDVAALRAAAPAVRKEIYDLFGAQGLFATINSDLSIDNPSFTPTQTQSLRPLLQVLSDAIA